MNIVPIQLAISSLKAHKTRSILTILGLSIGIAIVITIMAAGKGFDALVMGQLEVFSPDTITVEVKVPSAKKNSSDNAFGQASGITITTLNDKDLDTVKKNPNIISAYGLVMGQAVVKYQDQSKALLLMGEGYNVQDVEKLNLSSGRMYVSSRGDWFWSKGKIVW
jgi:ABC-type antimicrobial peptide transport system permease subunit